MFAVRLLIRQSHLVVKEGWPIYDCFTKFDLETWHLELIAGLVILISSARFLLLKTWPNFAKSSEASNQMELLLRGALMPLFGLNWKSVLVVAAIFGILHLGSGRKYPFAIWATFVGLAYGYAAIVSSSIIVPTTSHALNNLVGAILW
ncbi:hypothetical protein MKX01_027762 [Papaver californicum]|nr:hypothetical protein MKX01_027762 [Papaver californicum]